MLTHQQIDEIISIAKEHGRDLAHDLIAEIVGGEMAPKLPPFEVKKKDRGEVIPMIEPLRPEEQHRPLPDWLQGGQEIIGKNGEPIRIFEVKMPPPNQREYRRPHVAGRELTANELHETLEMMNREASKIADDSQRDPHGFSEGRRNEN